MVLLFSLFPIITFLFYCLLLQGGYVFGFVSLSVSRITQKVVDEFQWNFFLEWWNVWLAAKDWISVTIWITIRIREFWRNFYHYGIRIIVRILKDQLVCAVRLFLVLSFYSNFHHSPTQHDSLPLRIPRTNEKALTARPPQSPIDAQSPRWL